MAGNTIHIWEAIRQMRQISKKKGAFSFAFMSYSRSRGTSEGIIEIGNARLRHQDKSCGKYSDHMLNFVDLDTGESLRFWQPLLLYFNGQKIYL